MTKRTLLIDGDVVAYQAAASCEQAMEWEPGYWTWNVDFIEVTNRIQSVVEDVVEKLDADDYVLCLTDPKHNFRLDVLPTYKTHRKTVKKPLVLLQAKDWMVENMGAKIAPGLEGDDLMGIYATHNPAGKIIVSIDKDMKTIPCDYVRTKAQFDEDGMELVGAWDITRITPEEADAYWLKQTLSGDVTDGYSGCPGIGSTIADKIIDERLLKVPYEHELMRGPRKGQVETRYREEPHDDLWEVVVSHFKAVGLGEEEALRQARVARILRASDYDLKKMEPILWQPN